MLASQKQFDALVELFKTGTKLSYKRGEYVIRPGETPSAVFYIETGVVKAFNISKYGEENLLIIRKEREIFPLIWALTGQEREIIYQTMNDCVLWRIDRSKYVEFLHSHLSALPPILDMVTEMYRIHSERIINLEYRSVRARLASFLLTMASRFGSKSNGYLIIDLPLRHQEIASSINASRETTSREMSALEKKGYIVAHRSNIIIKDKEALQALL